MSRPHCQLSPDRPSAQFRGTVWYFASSVGSVLQTTDLSRAQPSLTATSSGIGWPPGMMGIMTDQEKFKAIFQVGNLGHKGRTCVSSTPTGLSPDSVLTWPGRVSEDRSSPPRLAQSLRFGPETPGLGCCRQVAICGVLASPRWENGLLRWVLGPLHRHKDTSASCVGGHTLGLSGYEHLSPSELSQQVGWPENGAEPLGHGPSSPQKLPNPH